MSSSQQFLVLLIVVIFKHKGGRHRATTVREHRKIKQFFTEYPKAVHREAKNEIPIDANLSIIKGRAR